MKIFVAAPFTDRIDPDSGCISTSYRTWLEKIILFLKNKGHQILSAHLREDWGKKLNSPAVALSNDFNAMKDVDLIIAYLTDPPSSGVLMELGMALSYHKRIIILVKRSSRCPYLIKGLHQLTDTVIVQFDNDVELLGSLDKIV